MINGARLRIGGMPAWLGVTVGAVIVWALIVMAAVTLAELTRRHHKTARRYAIRQGKRSALATGRTARRHSRALMARAVRWAAPRWQARTRAARPPDVGEAELAVTRRPDGKPETGADTRLFNLRGSGYAGPIDQDGYAVSQPSTTGGTTMSQGPASRIPPDRRARRTAARTGGAVPSVWGPVVAQAADFQPESDADLLDWMAGRSPAMAAYAEALIEAYETGVGTGRHRPQGPGRAARRRRRRRARRRDHVRRQDRRSPTTTSCPASSPPTAG